MFLLLDRTATMSEDGYDLGNLSADKKGDLLLINQWIVSRLSAMVHRIDDGMLRYDFHHATDALYEFLYGDLCDVFVEAIKRLGTREQHQSALVLATCLDVSLRCLAPFMPFLAEELYQRLHARLEHHRIRTSRSDSILIAKYPKKEEVIHPRFNF